MVRQPVAYLQAVTIDLLRYLQKVPRQIEHVHGSCTYLAHHELESVVLLLLL